MQDHPMISTHSHHLPDSSFQGFTLDSMLRQTYVNWCGITFDRSKESRRNYLEKVRYKSYFVWLQKALKELYGFEKVTADNWEQVSDSIQLAHQDASFHLQILKQKCGYESIVLDTYWHPGSDNGHPDLFKPTFRIDPFLYGYSKDAKDHDGNNPMKLYGEVPDNLTDYIAWVKEWIVKRKHQGCVAIKSAVAYDRSLTFETITKAKAEKVFQVKDSEKSQEDIANFQDYLFHRICEMAAELSLPLQCHTGMGQLTNTRAIALKNLIEMHSETKFVLFHCSFPWMGDTSGLLHAYPNVYPDLCWLPILSPSAAQSILHELIEIGTSDKVCWGCDTWTSEESYGALLAFRFVLAQVLGAKIKDGYFSLSDAEIVIDNLMIRNAAGLYGLKQG